MSVLYRHALVMVSARGVLFITVKKLVDNVEATNRQTVFNMKDGRSIATRDTLANIQDVLLKYPAFFKPHRSYIINLQYVEHFNSKEISMKNSACLIPIARGLDKEFKEKYFQFMFSE